jgi:hypothetical protein
MSGGGEEGELGGAAAEADRVGGAGELVEDVLGGQWGLGCGDDDFAGKPGWFEAAERVVQVRRLLSRRGRRCKPSGHLGDWYVSIASETLGVYVRVRLPTSTVAYRVVPASNDQLRAVVRHQRKLSP